MAVGSRILEGVYQGRASPARPRYSPLTTGVYVEFGGRTAPVARRLRSEGLDPYAIPRIAIGPSGTGRTGILTATLRVVVPASTPLEVLQALRSLEGPRGPPGLSRLSRVPETLTTTRSSCSSSGATQAALDRYMRSSTPRSWR